MSNIIDPTVGLPIVVIRIDYQGQPVGDGTVPTVGSLILPDGQVLWSQSSDNEDKLLYDLTINFRRDDHLRMIFPDGFRVEWDRSNILPLAPPAGPHDHCMHVTELTTGNPPKEIETCCWCGLKQEKKEPLQAIDHGPYVTIDVIQGRI